MELHERIIQANDLATLLKDTKSRRVGASRCGNKNNAVSFGTRTFGTGERAQKVADEITAIAEKYNAEYINELEEQVAKAFAGVEK